MSKILILEDDIINEYEVDYDQEYMNLILEEYRMKHAYLTTCCSNGKIKCSDSTLVKADITYDDMKITSKIISAVNPAVYNILYDSKNNGFVLDNLRIFTLMSWYKAAMNSANTRTEELQPIDDYQNIDEKIDVKDNITDLLSDIKISYVGPSDSGNKILARVGADFISEFNISKTNQKIKGLLRN